MNKAGEVQQEHETAPGHDGAHAPAEPGEEDARHRAPSRRHDLVFRELDGEALLYDPQTQAVHRFNATTLFVWNACDGQHTEGIIARAMAETYAVSVSDTRGHVKRVIDDFRSLGLLADHHGDPGAKASGFCPSNPGEADDGRLGPPKAASDRRRPGGRVPPRRSSSGPMSRRELLAGGMVKLVLVAPLVSTFFVQEAQGYNFSCYAIGHDCPGSESCCNGLTCCGTGKCGVPLFGACSTDSDCCSNDCLVGVLCWF